MPIYTFQCPVCKHKEDKLVKMSDKAPTCLGCKETVIMEKQISASAGFNLKGEGYYRGGYSSGNA